MEYLLGIDVGSSSVKAAILDANSGTCAGSAFYPKKEQIILAPEAGFADQKTGTSAIEERDEAVEQAKEREERKEGEAKEMEGERQEDTARASEGQVLGH